MPGGFASRLPELFQDQGLEVIKVSIEIPGIQYLRFPAAGLTDERDLIKKALIALDRKDQVHARLLAQIDKEYTGFVSAADSDYDGIRKVMEQLETTGASANRATAQEDRERGDGTMLSMINRFFQEGKGKALKDRIDSSMALKFMFVVTAVICVFMTIGTFLITVMLMRGENRALEARGRDIGQFLGKAVTEPLLRLDSARSTACCGSDKIPGCALRVRVQCLEQGPEQRLRQSSTRSHAEMKDLLARENTADVEVLAAKVEGAT